MKTPSPLSQEVWERTPAAAQAYIRALEARVAALEATVQRLLEPLWNFVPPLPLGEGTRAYDQEDPSFLSQSSNA